MDYPPYEARDVVPVEGKVTFGDTVFQTYTWEVPQGVAWAGRILFVHGYRDTHRTYHRHFEFFAKNGYDVFFFDQRGEGQTRLTNGKKGVSSDYYAYKGVDDMISHNLDIISKVDSARAGHLHVMGHSMGGGIVLNYAIVGEKRAKVRSFSTFAPLVTLHPATDPGIVTEYAVRFLCLFPFCRTLRVRTPLKPDYLTSDPHMAQYIVDNVDLENSDGAFVEARDFIMRGKNLLKPAVYSRMGLETPLLICHGEDDSINDCRGSRAFIEALNSIQGMHNKEFKLYPKGKHCLHIESAEIAQPLAQDMLDFINRFNGEQEPSCQEPKRTKTDS